MNTRYKKYENAAGFADKDCIYFNLFYPDAYIEDDIERAISYVFMHELIHTININIAERKVTYIGDVIEDSLIKIGLSKE